MLEERTFSERRRVPSQQREWERKEGQERSKNGDTKKKGACHNCNKVGHFAPECPKKKETNNASSSGGSDVHCLTYTDDQSQWIIMLPEVGHIREQSDNTKFLVDSGGGMPSVAVQGETWFFSGRDVFDCTRCASRISGYGGSEVSVGRRAR